MLFDRVSGTGLRTFRFGARFFITRPTTLSKYQFRSGLPRPFQHRRPVTCLRLLTVDNAVHVVRQKAWFLGFEYQSTINPLESCSERRFIELIVKTSCRKHTENRRSDRLEAAPYHTLVSAANIGVAPKDREFAMRCYSCSYTGSHSGCG
jgi:hypothetical protein